MRASEEFFYLNSAMNARTPDVSRNGDGKEKLVVAEQAKDVAASQGRESVAVAAKRAEERQMGVLQRLGGFGSALAKRLESAMVYAGNDILNAPGDAIRAGKKVAKAYDDATQWAGETIRGAGNMAKDVAVGAADIGWQATRGALYDIPKGTLEAGAAFAGKLAEDAVNDIKEAPATAMRAGKKVAKAYNDVAQVAGEAIIDGAKIAAKTGLEVGLIVPQTAIGGARAAGDIAVGAAEIAAANAELVGRGMMAAGEGMANVMEGTARGAGKLAKKGFEKGVDAMNAAAQDLVDAPATAKRAVKKGMKAAGDALDVYNDAAQWAGEAIRSAPSDLETLGLEAGSFIARETVPVITAPAELMADAMEATGRGGMKLAKKGFEKGVDVMNAAAQDLVDAPATAKRAVEKTFAWLDKLATRLTAPGEKAAVEKVAKSMRALEVRAGGARAERAAAADTAATRLLERLRAMPQTSRGDETTAARILSDIRARAELQRRAELHLQDDVMSAK